MTPSFTLRVAVAPDVMFRVVGDESVILHLKSEVYMGLDPVGTRMWVALTESPSIQNAYVALRSEYEVEAEDLRQDLQEFLDKLHENELIEIWSLDAPSQTKTE